MRKSNRTGTYRFLAPPHRAFLSLPDSSCIFERESFTCGSLTGGDSKAVTDSLAQEHERRSKTLSEKLHYCVRSHFILISLTPSFQPSPEPRFVYTAKFISGSESVVGSFSLAVLLIIKASGNIKS